MGIQIVAESDSVFSEDIHNQIMFELQKRMVDVENNREKKASCENEIADMVVLINKLSETYNIDTSLIDDRKSQIESDLS